MVEQCMCLDHIVALQRYIKPTSAIIELGQMVEQCMCLVPIVQLVCQAALV